MKTLTLFLFALCFGHNAVLAQPVLMSLKDKLERPEGLPADCPSLSDRAMRTARGFLMGGPPRIERLRAETGTEGIPVSQVRPVTDAALCRALNEIVQANASLQQDETKWIRYYYRVNDFIFVFYREIEFSTYPNPFHIFDKDLNLIKSTSL